jgi:hypothetical protein
VTTHRPAAPRALPAPVLDERAAMWRLAFQYAKQLRIEARADRSQRPDEEAIYARALELARRAAFWRWLRMKGKLTDDDPR